jgi:hypothetical protein
VPGLRIGRRGGISSEIDDVVVAAIPESLHSGWLKKLKRLKSEK